MIWTKGDGVSLAALSGWGSRDDLEHSFQKLERIKAPQKMIIYTCALVSKTAFTLSDSTRQS